MRAFTLLILLIFITLTGCSEDKKCYKEQDIIWKKGHPFMCGHTSQNPNGTTQVCYNKANHHLGCGVFRCVNHTEGIKVGKPYYQ